MDIQDFVLKIAEKIDYFLTWKLLSVCFFTTSVVLTVMHIPLIYIILEPMYTTIRTSVALIWLLSFSGIIYKILNAGFMHFKNKFEQNKLERQNKLEYEQRKTELIKKFSMLSASEKELIHIAMRTSSIWLPEVNAEVQLLLYKGLINKISSIGKYEDWDNSGEREWCILVIVPDEIRSILLSMNQS